MPQFRGMPLRKVRIVWPNIGEQKKRIVKAKTHETGRLARHSKQFTGDRRSGDKFLIASAPSRSRHSGSPVHRLAGEVGTVTINADWSACLILAGSEMLERDIVRNELEPCKEFDKLNASELISHIKKDGCLECLNVVRDLQREYEITDALWKRRN